MDSVHWETVSDGSFWAQCLCRMTLCSTEGTKREAEERVESTSSMTFCFPWEYLKEERILRKSWNYILLMRGAFHDPPFLGCLVSSLSWGCPHQPPFWFLVHAVTQYGEPPPPPFHGSKPENPWFPFHTCSSPQSSMKQEAEHGWRGGGRRHCSQFSISAWVGR